MLRFGCLLILVCAIAQTQAVKIYAQSAELPAAEDVEDVDEVEDPEPEGRIISFFREQEPARYSFDGKPIVITAPGPVYSPPIYAQPAPAPQPPPPPPPQVVYPQPYPQLFPQPFPQPVPVPVPVPPPPPPTTIIKPIISYPHHHHHDDHHDHHHHRPRPIRPIYSPFGFGNLGSLFAGAEPFFNFTYSPVLSSSTSSTPSTTSTSSTTSSSSTPSTGSVITRFQQFNDISQLAQLLSQLQQQQQQQQQLQPFINPALYISQPQLGQLQQVSQLQQLLQAQPQFVNQAQQSAQTVTVPSSLLWQALAAQQQQLPTDQLANFDLEALQQQLAEASADRRKFRPQNDDDYVMRRSKPKKKSKKSKKNKGQAKQVIFLALDSAEAVAEAQAQAKAQGELLQ